MTYILGQVSIFRRFSWCWSCSRSLLHGRHIEFLRYVSFLGSVPPGICSLTGSDATITRNRAKGFWCPLTVCMHCQVCANAFWKKSFSHTTYWTPTPPISLCSIWISSWLSNMFFMNWNIGYSRGYLTLVNRKTPLHVRPPPRRCCLTPTDGLPCTEGHKWSALFCPDQRNLLEVTIWTSVYNKNDIDQWRSYWL